MLKCLTWLKITAMKLIQSLLSLLLLPLRIIQKVLPQQKNGENKDKPGQGKK